MAAVSVPITAAAQELRLAKKELAYLLLGLPPDGKPRSAASDVIVLDGVMVFPHQRAISFISAREEVIFYDGCRCRIPDLDQFCRAVIRTADEVFPLVRLSHVIRPGRILELKCLDVHVARTVVVTVGPPH